MVSRWDPLIGKLFGAFPIIAAMSLVALEASISADKIRSVQKGWPAFESHSQKEFYAANEQISNTSKDMDETPGKSNQKRAGGTTGEHTNQSITHLAHSETSLVDPRPVWGTSVFSNGTTVEGEHLNGIPHGVARAVTAKGLIQEGEYVNGVLHGRGSIVGNGWGFADTETAGLWVQGKRHGAGRKLAPYVLSEGVCVDGEQQGEWTYSFKNGRVMVVNHDCSTVLDDFKLFWASFG